MLLDGDIEFVKLVMMSLILAKQDIYIPVVLAAQ